jgi:tetratricopeptide (TPR) repeat protein
MPTVTGPRPSAFRLYCSRRTRLSLGLAAIVMLLGAVVLAFAFARTTFGPALGGTLVGAAIVLAALLTRTRLPGEECASCGQARAGVRVLVCSPQVALCDACAAVAMAAVTEDLENKGKADESLRLMVEALPPKCPREISRALLEALLDGAAEPPLLRQVASSASRLHNHPLAVELLERIPESERTAGDWLNLGFALGKNGRDADALAATTKALAIDDGTHRALCLNNAVWFGCQLARPPSAEQKTRWLADLEEAKRLLSEHKPAGWQLTLQCCHGTEAELQHATGDDTRALQALAAAEKLGPLGGERLLIRARALASSGLPTRAREQAEQALQGLHPQSRSAEEARQLLATLR